MLRLPRRAVKRDLNGRLPHLTYRAINRLARLNRLSFRAARHRKRRNIRTRELKWSVGHAKTHLVVSTGLDPVFGQRMSFHRHTG